MTPPTALRRPVPAGTGRAGSRTPPPGPDEAGFSLVETMIALVIFSVLMASLAALFVGGLRTSAGLADRQTAVTLANQALEIARSVPPAPDVNQCPRLLQGRSQSAVNAQWAAGPSGVDLTGTDPAWMPVTCSGSTVLPLQGLASTAGAGALDPVPVGGLRYTVRTFVGTCRMPRTGGACQPAAQVSGSAVTLYRVIAAVTWTDAGCSPTCTYAAATLVDSSSDSLFNSRSSAPGAPTQVVATPGDATATVTWAAPITNTDVSVISYTVTATPASGGTPATCTAFAPIVTCTLTGLTNGVTYLVTVTATSATATGPASAAVPVTPYPASIMTASRLRLWLDGADTTTLFQNSGCTVAAAAVSDPVGCWKDKSGQANDAVQATTSARPALATVSRWAVPGFDGSTQLMALTSAALLPNGTTPSSTFVVGRMTDTSPGSSSWRTLLSWGSTSSGTSRSYQKQQVSSAAVVDSIGKGTSSAGTWVTNAPRVLSDAWTSSAYTGYLNGAAGTPVSGSFTTGTGSALVGDQLGPAGQRWLGQIPEAIVLTGAVTTTERRILEEYLVRKWGGSLTPQAPTGVSATGASTSATVTFTAPAWDGGSPITSYTLVATPGSGPVVTATGCTGSPCTITGLATGTTYSITVAAVNANGTGPASSPASATTSGAPGSPTGLTAVPTNAAIALSWTAPALTGGGITGYTASATSSAGSATCSNAGTSCTLTGLTNGVAYTITVTATSAGGTSPPSASITSIPYPSAVIGGSSLRLWLDASDLDADGAVSGAYAEAGTVSGAVQTWKDRSGWARDVTAASSAQRPAYTTRTINGLPVVTGDGTQLLSGATAVDPYAMTADRTLVVVTRPRVWTSGATPAGGDGTYLTDRNYASSVGANPLFSLKVCGSPAAWCLQHRVDSSSSATSVSGSMGPSAGRTDIVVATRSGSTDALSVTGAASGSATLSGTITQQPVTVHRHPNQTTSQDVDLAEVLLFNRALSAAEQSTLQAYLATKWQVPLTPGAPTGLSATAGDTTAALTWTAPSTGSVTGYTATAVPSDGSLPNATCSSASTSCSLTGLFDGVTYTVSVVASNAAGNGPASASVTVIPFPAVLAGANIRLWLDGADPATQFQDTAKTTATTTAGQPIAAWKDKSGQGNDVLAPGAVPGTAPTADTTAFPGKTVPVFASGRYLTRSSGFPTASDYSVFAVYRATNSSCDNNVLSGTSTRAFYPANGNGMRVWHSGSAAIISAGGAANVGYVASGTFATSSKAASVDVNAGAAVNATLANGNADAGIQIGAYSGGYGFCGQIAEAIALNKVVTTTERRTVSEYLARKWAIAVTPAAPTAVSGTAGSGASTVSWTAPTWDGGSTITSYTATASPGGATCTAGYPATSCVVSGLNGGTSYTFTVTATNAVGTGPASSPSSPVTAVSTAIYAWGKGLTGATGALMGSSSTSISLRLPGPESWSGVSAGSGHTCAISSGSALYCWGANASGQLGVGDTTTRQEPQAVASGSTWSSVSAGYSHTCGIKTTGTLWCWGYNADGQAGDGTSGTNRTSPVQVSTSGTTTWSTVSAGQYFSCGIKTDSTLWCWGNGGNGRLGIGSTANKTTPNQVMSGTSFSAVGAGWGSACAIKSSDSSLVCWGTGAYGQLGNGGTGDQTSPVAVSGGGTWSAVEGGWGFSCGIKTTGALWCWGYNQKGELGNNTTSNSSTPVQENTGSTAWTAVQASGDTTCATRSSGQLYCWGYNGHGEVGDGTTTDRSVPVTSGSSTSWTSIASGETSFCGIRSGGSIWCQGDDANYQLGQHYGQAIGSPTPLSGPSGTWTTSSWDTGSSGVNGSCAVADTGTLWCWGYNLEGEAGDGTTTQRSFPVQAGAATTWASVSAGTQTVCGIQTDASLWCWGSTTYQQTGISGASGNKTTPTAGPAGSWSSVTVGDTHTCGIKTDGTLWCWGNNASGQLGLGNTTNYSTPQQVSVAGITTWTAVSAGAGDTCAIAGTGSHPSALYCWGANASGQVGNASTTTVNTPTRPDSSTWSQVAVGNLSVCGVRTTGALYCWGQNTYGQLGQGGAANSPAYASTPQQVGSATTWTQAGVGDGYSCAGRSDTTVWCWGRDDYRQLGDRNVATTQTSPKQVTGLAAGWVELHGKAQVVLALAPSVAPDQVLPAQVVQQTAAPAASRGGAAGPGVAPAQAPQPDERRTR